MLDRGYRLWNMIMVSTLSSGDREETLIEFPVFTAALLNGDIYKLHHVTSGSNRDHTRQQTLLAQS